MDLEQKFRLIRSIGEECTAEVELRNLLETKNEPICIDGFEPSGRMHIAQGILRALNVKKLTSAGCRVKIMIADLFAKLNNKMGGDLEMIEVVGKYYIEIWKAIGMDLELGKVEILWSSQEILRRADEYWQFVMDVSGAFDLQRLSSCCQAMGWTMKEQWASSVIYPCMQCTDIFFLKADICQMGMDQREVNVLARDYCDVINMKSKPIILSHHMLPGLKQGQKKMSSSDPSSSIFMDDEPGVVNVKIKKAFCPPMIVDGNPCMEYVKYLIFPWFGVFRVERNAENSGDSIYQTFEDLVAEYESGQLHPGDLKASLAKAINSILQPVQDHFVKDPYAKDLLGKVKAYEATRPLLLACGKNNLKHSKVGERSHVIEDGDELARTMSFEAIYNNQSEASSSVTSSGTMDLEQKFHLIRSIGEECTTEVELWNLLETNNELICYDGFEPSGRMHIAQGVLKALNVNKLTSAGCRMKIWIADWFAKLNNKMGGDLSKIKVVGMYFIEIWKAIGMDIEGKVEFLWSSQEINRRPQLYWPLVLDIAAKNKLPRIIRCCQIMGRNERDKLKGSQIMYPCMQCADIFFLEADICQLGMDQRKVNVLAREYCDSIKREKKPIILSHHMLPGLLEGQEKMSKSDPSSSIFMEDEEIVVEEKIKGASCPEMTVKGNPCMEYVKYLVFPWFGVFKVERKGGDSSIYPTYEDLVAEYESGQLESGDLKASLAKAINSILQPVRDHFGKDPNAKELLRKVKAYRVTR